MKTTLFIFLGIPGSGKTHFVKQLCQEYRLVHLSSDRMRKSIFGNPDKIPHDQGNPMVFGALDYAVYEVLKAGASVAYDANHNFRTIRIKTRKIAADLNIPVVTIWLKVPLEIAIHRAGSRQEDDYTRVLTEDKVRGHYDRLEAPAADEPHIVIDGTLPFKEQLVSFHIQLQAL